MNERSDPAVILVLDDEFLIAVAIESILTEAGYEVVSAVSIAEARRLMSERPPDLAVLDFRLGDGAADLAADLVGAGVPLLFCTGSLPEEVQAVFPGAAVVAKPFADDILLAAVRRMLPG